MSEGKPDTRTRAQHNRAIRQEELRQKLAAGAHLDLAIDLADKMSKAADEKASENIVALKSAFDARMKLVNKYMPELKATELSTDPVNPLVVSMLEFPEE